MGAEFILGTVQLGLSYGINNLSGKPTEEESIHLLKLAADNGIQTLDTAQSYGNSSELIGSYHRLFPKNKFQVITKFSGNTSNAAIELFVENSLQTMAVDALYACMFHNYATFKAANHSEKIFSQLKKEGKIKYAGVSVYTNNEMLDVINNSYIDLIQFPFNMLDNENLRKEVLIAAKEKGKILHARSVFLQGLFWKETETFPVKLKPLQSYLLKLKSIATENEVQMQDLALKYVMDNTYIDGVVIGMESADQLLKNVNSSKVEVPSLAIQQVNEKIRVNELELLNPSLWN